MNAPPRQAAIPVRDWPVVRASSRAAVLGGVLATLVACGPAQAEKGVHIDPHSPAGVEYAVPLDQARGDSAHHGAGSGGSGGSGGSTRFGAGITPPANAHSGTTGQTAASGRKTRRGQSQARRSHGAAQTADPAPSTPVAAAGSGSDYSSVALGAVIGAVLLAGAGIGVLLRRRARTR